MPTIYKRIVYLKIGWNLYLKIHDKKNSQKKISFFFFTVC